jgi:hypothetical protein
MDDHHDQPIWPMIQGAANYAWNLIEEAWAMIWRPAIELRACAVRDDAEDARNAEGQMREVDGGVAIAVDPRITPES